MRLAPTGDDLLFARTTRDLLAARCTPADVRAGFSRERWQALAAIGATGLLVPEAEGGLGLGDQCRGAQSLVALTEEAGRACLPEPLLEAAVAAVLLAAQQEGPGPATDRTRLLRGLADGAVTVAVSVPATRPAGSPGPEGVVVAHAAYADHVLLVTDDGILMDCVQGSDQGCVPDRGPDRAPEENPRRRPAVPGVDPGRALGRVLGRVVAGEGGRPPVVLARGCGAAGERAGRLGAIGAAADLLGAAAAMLERTVEYARQRVQFGRAIGTQQAVKHQLADVLLALEFARPVVARAAYSYDLELPSEVRDAAMAKVFATEAAQTAARTCLQVHGAIGYTDECDLALWLRRVWALSAGWGDVAHHRAAVAADLLAPNGPSPSCPTR